MDERVTSQMTEQEVNRYKELFDENQKLVIMVSERKLSLKTPKSDEIQYYEIPDLLIEYRVT